MHATGVGKVLLAHAPAAVQAEVLGHLTRITPYTINQPGTLRRQLARVLRDDYATQEPSAPQLWPEHFDLACDLGNLDAGTCATYGVSPGDADIAEPYLYVSPWETSRRTGVLGRKPFGAACSYRDLGAEGDGRNAGRAFFSDCAALLLGAP